MCLGLALNGKVFMGTGIFTPLWDVRLSCAGITCSCRGVVCIIGHGHWDRNIARKSRGKGKFYFSLHTSSYNFRYTSIRITSTHTVMDTTYIMQAIGTQVLFFPSNIVILIYLFILFFSSLIRSNIAVSQIHCAVLRLHCPSCTRVSRDYMFPIVMYTVTQ